MDVGRSASGPSAPKGLIAARAPEAALLALALFGLGAMGNRPLSLALSGALGLVAYLSLRLRLRELLAELRFLGSLCILLFAVQALRVDGLQPRIDAEGARSAALSCARIAITYTAARAFYAGMGVSRIRDGLARLARPLAPILGSDGAAALGLSLGLVPTVLGIWIETEEAARVRGLGARIRGAGPRGLARSLRSLRALVAAFLRRLLLLARDLAEARATRGSGAAPRTLPPLSLSLGDALLVGAAALPLLAGLL